MAAIYKRGKQGIWWIKYYVAGKPLYHSLRTTNARVAERIKRQIGTAASASVSVGRTAAAWVR